ncbi:MBL fold metallo-hydrolase [Sphaerisporangium krabiense]|uniref:Alkyl sulfatase BDS1-like metallo-beta-lactamase superfamily hydrolase n=1 Tax=Sphaerisporangium krabiense TaxID=763782 RepID=A0A7W8Z6X7_9ACTN|nr:alkyl sulfatase dimerization domain-containing protein [Sphaerisporangium krabiense]MBB5628591.1 alkyl sulfatase BDS1-like metallo-beta-lactamase superfamily hydrolase [Sphaerisporangium krabiense]GII60573.1 MBL fold metallo-hydrolase [Sphaerisporangium krabiense]
MTSPILDHADSVWRGAVTPGEVPLGDLRSRGAQEVAEGVVMWPAFGNVYGIRGDGGLALFDTGNDVDAPAMHAAMRAWSDEPVRYAVFSHGHLDHVAGLGPFEAEDGPRPVVIAHEAVTRRFARYARTAGYNTMVNQRQYGFSRLTWPASYRQPDLTYRDEINVSLGEVTFEMRHARGETDDATWAFLPERGVLLTGDLFAWVTPNAGNPQKAQRYPDEWAVALRAMAALGAEVLLPGHGLPVAGAARVRQALTETADYLDHLVERTLELMNAGARLDEIVHAVRPPEALARRPFLRPYHDEPEFVVRNVWRLYGGWHDGNPAHLKPAPDEVLARALADLAGGAPALAARAATAAAEGDPRLACQLAELAVQAGPGDHKLHEIRARVYTLRARQETSIMARGVYTWAAAESRSVTSGEDLLDVYQEIAGGRVWWVPDRNRAQSSDA